MDVRSKPVLRPQEAIDNPITLFLFQSIPGGSLKFFPDTKTDEMDDIFILTAQDIIVNVSILINF